MENPAVAKLTAIPPALLEEIDRNPKVMQPIYAKMLAVNMNYVHHRAMTDPNITMGQRLQIIDTLAKLGDAYPKANVPQLAAQGAGFSVNIIMNNDTKAVTRAVVEDVSAKEVQPETITDDKS